MSQLAIVERPLVVEHDGERRSYQADEIIENFGDWPSSARTAAIEMERVRVLPDLEVVRELAAAYGYVLKPKPKA